MIELTLNGKTHCIEDALSVAGLLQQMGLANRKVAVERNGTIVPRSLHADTILCTGDRLEVVVAVGGG